MSEILTPEQIETFVTAAKWNCTDRGSNIDAIVSSHEALRARIVKLEAERDNTYGVISRLATAIWEMEYKPKAPEWRAEPDILGVVMQIDNMDAGVRNERDAAIQRGDSNYAAFEQVTKIAEGLREHLRKMLDALPAERAREIADHHMHAENCDVMRMRSTVPHPCNCWSDGDARTLNSYAEAAKDAQASLSGAGKPAERPFRRGDLESKHET